MSLLKTLFALVAVVPLITANAPGQSRQITIVNSCKRVIWPAMGCSKEHSQPDHASGWEMQPGTKETFTAPGSWTAGRIWARTGCGLVDGEFKCLTGGCGQGKSGKVECDDGVGGDPGVTLAEFTFVPGENDWYDVSLVDGFNIPMKLTPSISNCTAPTLASNINLECPPELRSNFDSNGVNMGCMTACTAGYGGDQWGNYICCSGAYGTPETCPLCGIPYYNLFKDNCKDCYAFAYDENYPGSAIQQCPSTDPSDYTIEFCPDGSDFMGATEPQDTKYFADTAKCTGNATTWSTTFAVTSPTARTQGTMSITAVVSATEAVTQSSGAASIAQGGESVSPTAAATEVSASVSSTPVDTEKLSSTDAAPSPTIRSTRTSTRHHTTTVTATASANQETAISSSSRKSCKPRATNKNRRDGQYLRAVPADGKVKKRSPDAGEL
ncbi:hypothetical protein IAU60_005357 [Kwoniella sp. DSM 27419]